MFLDVSVHCQKWTIQLNLSPKSNWVIKCKKSASLRKHTKFQSIIYKTYICCNFAKFNECVPFPSNPGIFPPPPFTFVCTVNALQMHERKISRMPTLSSSLESVSFSLDCVRMLRSAGGNAVTPVSLAKCAGETSGRSLLMMDATCKGK